MCFPSPSRAHNHKIFECTPMQSLGLMEVRTVLVTMLSRFHFELDPEMGGAEEVNVAHFDCLLCLAKLCSGCKIPGTNH